MFTRSIPAFIDGSLFKAPYIPEEPDRRRTISGVEKGEETPVDDYKGSLASGENKRSQTQRTF